MNENKKGVRAPIRTVKPKNPVAKNASKAIGGGAAGAHKDKKRAMKQGDVKHKKAEVAESYEDRLTQQLNELSIDSLKSYKAKRQVQQDAAKAAVPNPRTGDKDWIDQAVRGINMNTAQRKINRKEKTVAEEMDIPADGTPEYDQFIRRGGVDQKTPYDLGGADAYYGRQNDITKEYGFEKGSPEWDEYIQGYRDTYSNQDMRKDYGSSRSSVQPRRITRTSEAMNGITGPGMMNDPAMEDEGDKEGLPHLTPELAKHIADQIDSEGAHAIVKSVEWGDGAADELVQFIKHALTKFAGNDTDTVVGEDSALEKFRKGSAEREKKHADIEAKRKAAPPGSGMKSAIDRLEKQVKGEGWTHDSLADELFEHERTYEEQLQSKLNKAIGK